MTFLRGERGNQWGQSGKREAAGEKGGKARTGLLAGGGITRLVDRAQRIA